MQTTTTLIKQLPATRSLSLLVAALALVIVTSTSCESSVQSHGTNSQVEARASPSPNLEAASACERIRDIKILPFKDEPVDDPAYNALLQAGEKAVPCLVRAINDTREMRDPRTAPTVGEVAVGDVAYFLLVRFTKLDFNELLPAEVREKYAADGVYGYFRYIDENDNRRKLQEAAYTWYEKKYNRNLKER